MKMYVVTDAKGEIVATLHDSAGSKTGATLAEPQTAPGQKVHLIDLPKELEGVKNASQLHERLKAHVNN
jgi:hypothetical protein